MPNCAQEENGHFSQTDDKYDKITNYKQNLCALLALLHYITCGILTAFPSILFEQLQTDTNWQITLEDKSWIVSIYCIPLGPAVISLLLPLCPRRYLLITICILQVIGLILTYFYASSSVPILIVARVINGTASTMAGTIIPAFIGETTHPKHRSAYISCTALGLSTGLLIAHVLGAFFHWTICIYTCLALVLALFTIICYLKESYTWHMKSGNHDGAMAAFHWYRGDGHEARVEITRVLEEPHKEHQMPISQCLRSSLLWRPFAVVATLMATMHLSGYKVIVFYSMEMMRAAVAPGNNAYLAAIIVDVLRLVMTVVGMWLVKTLPLRAVLLISGLGSAFMHYAFAAIKFNVINEAYSSLLCLIALLMYVAFAAIGLASLPWIVCGEIFPMPVKSVGNSLAMFFYYLVMFLSLKFMPILAEIIGVVGEFLLFGGCTTIGVLILYFIMPETKNRTLKEIEAIFSKENNHL